MTLNLRYNYKQVSIERKNIMSEQTELLERPYINIVNVIWSFDRETSQVNMLLVKRANEPEKGAWAMPETYLRTEESADAAALRLVREKIGLNLSAIHTEQLATFTNPMRSGRGRDRILSLAYMTFLPEMPPLKAGYGATDARWFAFSAEDGHYVVRNGALHFKASEATSQAKYYENAEYDPKTHLAFDYDWIFKVACERIRNKLNYRPNVLLVLGSTFTMREARCVYAPFLMKKVDAIDNSNFRKTHMHLLKEIGTETVQKRPGRPAKIYALKSVEDDESCKTK